MDTNLTLRSSVTHSLSRTVTLAGLGEEESLVVTGGAADHLAVVYRTDDQVSEEESGGGASHGLETVSPWTLF